MNHGGIALRPKTMGEAIRDGRRDKSNECRPRNVSPDLNEYLISLRVVDMLVGRLPQELRIVTRLSLPTVQLANVHLYIDEDLVKKSRAWVAIRISNAKLVYNIAKSRKYACIMVVLNELEKTAAVVTAPYSLV